MNWTILGSVLGAAGIFAGAWIKIAQTGRRETCMRKFEKIATDLQEVKGNATGSEKQINTKFAEIERRLESIEDEMKGMRTTIEKIWMNMNKRKDNGVG